MLTPTPITRPALRRPRTLADRLAGLGGGDLDILDNCPQDRAAAVRLGAVICSTALMASVSMAFTLHMAFRLPVAAAAAGGAAWGALVIGPLDAYLVSVLRRQRRPVVTLAMALPRIAMAFLLAFTVSVPLTLALFSPEIAAQVATDEQNAKQAFDKRIANDPRFAQIPALQAQITTLQQTAVRVDQLRAAYDNAEALVACEEEGTCGTHLSGVGPIVKADVAAAAEIAAELLQAEDSQRASEASAAGPLPEVVSRVDELRNQRLDEMASAEVAIDGRSANLTARLHALRQLAHANPDITAIWLAVVLLLIAAEVTPTVTSLLASSEVPGRAPQYRPA